MIVWWIQRKVSKVITPIEVKLEGVKTIGAADTITKAYIRENAVFADAFNYLIYGGRQVVNPEELKEVDTTEIIIPFNTYDENKDEKYYDVAKLISDKLLNASPDNVYWKINRFQLLKRKRDLSEDELQELEDLEKTTDLKEWNSFITALYDDISNNKFPTTGKSFKIPLSKVQKYKLQKKGISKIFLIDL